MPDNSQPNKYYRSLIRKADRLAQHLNDVLRESFPEYAERYKIVHEEVTETVIGALGPQPVSIPYGQRPAFEYYLTPVSDPTRKHRVMQILKPDLGQKVKGGIKNERKHYYIDEMKKNIEKGVKVFEETKS